jgi:hypothetical protein
MARCLLGPLTCCARAAATVIGYEKGGATAHSSTVTLRGPQLAPEAPRGWNRPQRSRPTGATRPLNDANEGFAASILVDDRGEG